MKTIFISDFTHICMRIIIWALREVKTAFNCFPKERETKMALTIEALAAEGGFDVLFINQADVLTGAAAQLRPFADVLPCPVVYGSLARGAWRSL